MSQQRYPSASARPTVRALRVVAASSFIAPALSFIAGFLAERFLEDIPWLAGTLFTAFVVLAMVSFFHTRKTFKRIDDITTPLDPRGVDESALAHVTDVVTVFDSLKENPGKPENYRPVQSLLRRLPHLKALHLVMTPDEQYQPARGMDRLPARDRIKALDSWLEEVFPDAPPTVTRLEPAIGSASIAQEDIERLAQVIEHRAKEADGLVVDITGGTKSMSILMHEAATRAGVPVIYTIQSVSTGARGDELFGGVTLLQGSLPHTEQD